MAIARDVLAEPFLAVARDRDRDPEVRSSVLHSARHPGRLDAHDATSIIEDDTQDVEFRETAIFALSQLDEDEGPLVSWTSPAATMTLACDAQLFSHFPSSRVTTKWLSFWKEILT